MATPRVANHLSGFEKFRGYVLSNPFAHGIKDEEVKAYLARLSPERFSALVLRNREQGQPFLQPRGGVPTWEKQRQLTQALSDAGSDFIPLTIDSITRHNNYDKSDVLLKRSEEENKDFLNGFPLVNHGFRLGRALYEGVERPISLRHGTPDARLLVEIALAAGITEIEGGGIVYNLPYSKSFPLDLSLNYWQYVDRLCAHYSTPERPIQRESFGPMTATLVPPCMVIVIQLIELLLACEQGVKSFSVSFGQTGSLAQDIVTANLLRAKARALLKRFGFEGVQLNLVYHQWMGAFPMDRDLADSLITSSALIAQLVDADKVVVKTRDEAFGIPTIASNCAAVRNLRYTLRTNQFAHVGASLDVAAEAELIGEEVDSILEAIFALDGEEFWNSVYDAIRLGIIDVPFAPHADNANLMLSVRAPTKEIRIIEAGKVPLSASAIKEEKARAKLGDGRLTDKIINDIFIMV